MPHSWAPYRIVATYTSPSCTMEVYILRRDDNTYTYRIADNGDTVCYQENFETEEDATKAARNTFNSFLGRTIEAEQIMRELTCNH
jgi:hypothetical protein